SRPDRVRQPAAASRRARGDRRADLLPALGRGELSHRHHRRRRRRLHGRMTGEADGPLAARLAAVEARLALSELVARYCHRIDARDFDGVLALFTEDAGFHHPGGTVRGHAELATFFSTQLGQYEATYHYPHSHVVDLL